MKSTLVIAAVVLMLAGCGRASGPKDPFTGTWRTNAGNKMRLVISKQDGHYHVVWGLPGWTSYGHLDADFARRGNALVGVVHKTNEATGKVVTLDTIKLSVGKASRSLLFHNDSTYSSKPFDATMTKMSDSTATPTPVP